MVPYEILFYTGDVKEAGTDAAVSFTVFGENGSTPEIQLHKEGEMLERGRIDIVKVTKRETI